MTSAKSIGASINSRTLLGRSLVGQGIEIGPGHQPFPLAFGGATARYVDRWDPETNRLLFPEVDGAGFVEPDVLANLDIERLSAFGAGSQDFVIASHVLEHLSEPIGQLVDIHRVLRPGGTLLLLLPERTRTFDRTRQPTPLAHLVDEHRRGVTEVDDLHLIEFVTQVPDGWGSLGPPERDAERFDSHRRRSIHVHCWNEAEFAEVVVYTIVELGLGWELIDRLDVDDSAGEMEFGLALRRPTVCLPGADAGDRFWRIWQALRERPSPASPAPPPASESAAPADAALIRELTETKASLEAAQAVIARHEQVLGPLRRIGALDVARALIRRLEQLRNWSP